MLSIWKYFLPNSLDILTQIMYLQQFMYKSNHNISNLNASSFVRNWNLLKPVEKQWS
jgi:uncharacterized membrane protein